MLSKTRGLLLIVVSVLSLAGAGIVGHARPVTVDPFSSHTTSPHETTGSKDNTQHLTFEANHSPELTYKINHHGRSQREESDFQTRLIEAAQYLRTATEGRTTRLDENQFSDIRIRLPDQAHSNSDRDIIQYAREELLPRLSQSISRDNLYIINMARDIGSEVLYAEEIPQDIRAKSEGLSNFFNKKPSPLRHLPRQLFNKLPMGAMVVIVGHVNATNKTLVGDEAIYNVSELSELAKSKMVNLVILGCNSALVADIGTTRLVNSFVLLKQLGAYLSNVSADNKIVIGDFYGQAARASGGLLLTPIAFEIFVQSDAVNKDGAIERTDYLSFDPVGPSSQSTSASMGEEPPWLVTLTARFTLLALAVSAMWGVLHNLAYKGDSEAGVGLFGHFLLVFPILFFNMAFREGSISFLAPSLLVVTGILIGVGGWKEMTWLGRFRAIFLGGAGLLYCVALLQ